MEPKEKALSKETDINDFEAERELIEEKHRTEVLNLLKCFEFERTDMETRFQERLEVKNNDGDSNESSVNQNEVDELKEKLKREKDELQEQFDKEKASLMARLKKLEGEVVVKRESDSVGRYEDDDTLSRESEVDEQRTEEKSLAVLKATDSHHECSGESSAQEVQKDESKTSASIESRNATGDQQFCTEDYNSRSSENGMKSLSELKEENQNLKQELDDQSSEIGELQNQVNHLSGKLDDIRELFENDDINAADKKERLRELFEGCSTELTDGRHETRKEQGEASSPVGQQHRSNSEMSFALEELNMETEDLKNNVYEMEQKIRRTIEEYEMQRSVFKEKLNGIVEKLMESQSQEGQNSQLNQSVVENTINELRGITLEETSQKRLLDYVNIVQSQKSGSQSPDVFDVNLLHEIQSLEQLLDLEIFDGRVFDEEMKDEVKQVLRDKERELMVAYTVEKLREELRNRFATETVMEELQKEREKDYFVNQAVNEVLKGHLGISTTGKDSEELEKALANNSQEEPRIREEEIENGAIDVDALKAEKEELEGTLQELQDYFEKERQDWLQKLQSPLQEDSTQVDNKDKVIQSLRAQNVIMEQVLNTERFYLSRVYYMEMKEELDASLKQYQFERGGKLEKEIVTEAWKHHVEVGELYQEILQKETESIENIKEKINEEERKPEICESPKVSSEDELRKENLRLEIQLPIKLELAELQRKRCREHKAVSLILEQAVTAVETAVQEQDAFLVNSDFLQRRSSWPNSDDDTAMPEQDFTESRFSRATTNDKENKIGKGEDVNENSINGKSALRKALGRLLEKLLNEQPEVKDSEPDSCASDSDFDSELEGSPRRDQPSEDEITVKKKKFETGDVLADDSPRGSLSDIEIEAAKEVETEDLELKNTPKISEDTSKNSENVSRDSEDMSKDPESMPEYSEHMSKDSEYKSENPKDMAKDSECKSKDSEDMAADSEEMLKDSEDASKNFEDSSKASVPEIFKLPPKIENLLNIERFNMSRLLRDEYVDKIRRGRRKIRRMRPQNYDNNEELLTKFKEHVGLLLDKTDFGEGGEEKGDVKQKRLASTPSDDSGIADFVESDKDAVVRKYKELLEKARKDLNRAHRALREKPGKRNENEINNELGAMKRNLKEKENDLQELGDKRVGLENEREVLLDKIKSTTDPTNGAATDSETKTGDDFGQVVKEQHDSQSPLATEIKVQTDQQLSQMEPFPEAIGADDGTKLDEASPETGVPEDTTTEIEVERGLLVRENEELKGKLDALEKEMESKDKEFYHENKKKQDEVNELQRKLVEGTGGEDILVDLQEKLNEANEEKRKLETKCSEIEKRKTQGELGSEKKYEDDAAKEMKTLRNENAILENEIKLKQEKEKVEELRGKMMEGADGEEIVRDLQHELNEKNEMLEKTNKELGQEGSGHLSAEDKEKVIAELERENETLGLENQETTKKLEKLQHDVLGGTGSEAILEGLQDEVKDLKAVNKDLEKKCYDLEENKKETFDFKGKDMKQLEKELERANKEKERLDVENKSKEEEIADLQKKLVEGSGGEELLGSLQQQVKELKEKDAELETHCQKLEDLNEELKDTEDTELEKEISKMKNENAKLADENKTKDSEVCELQKALVEGSGGEEILQKLQHKIKETEDNNKMLEKQCSDVSNDNENLEEKENDARNEKKEMATELARIKKENDYLERESQAKTGEISKLQEKLLDGTGGEEILQDLQAQMKELEDMNKELRKKCNEMEAREETSKEDEDDVNKEKEKELSELKRKNERLLKDNKEKEKEVSDLQKKLVEGTGGEELLESLQQKVKELKEKDADLELYCQNLEDLNEKLKNEEVGNSELEKEISKIKKENAKLTDGNKTKDSQVRELQKALVEGSGGEEILQELQDNIKETEKNNKMLEKQCGDLSSHNEDLEKKENDPRNEKKEMATELVRIKKENDYLERGSQAKTGEISKLQEKLLDGTGGEEILQELQGQLKELEDMNKELRKKCNEMEAHEETSKEDEDDVNKEKEKEMSELKRKNERLLLDNNEKEKEVSDLQKKLVEGTGGEELLESLQQKVKELKEKDADLELYCQNLEDLNEKLKNEEVGNSELEKEISKIKKENVKLTDGNKTKDSQVRELQKALVEGSGGEEILQELQDKIKETEENNKMLEKQCGDLSSHNEDLEKKENDPRNEKKAMATELVRIKKENDYLERGSQAKTGEISKLQEKLLDGTGGEEILQELQGQLKELEDMNKELRKKCNEMEAHEETSKEDEDDVNKEKEKEMSELKRKNERLLLDNNEKEKEVSDLQKKLVEGTGGEELLESLQQKVKELKEKDADLELYCQNLEDLNEKLKNEEVGNSELEKEISKIKKENVKLTDGNKTKDSQVRELQKALVEGSGGEEILQELQDKIKETEENNKMLEKQCGDLSSHNEDLEKKENDPRNEKKGMATELVRIKKENDYLERGSQAKTGEISKLQEKLLDGTGGEEILQELQGQLKELEDMNKELRKKCNEMEAHEETSKEDEDDVNKEKEKEMSELKRKNERLLVDNNEKEKEVSDLQKKLVEGTGGEELLESLQQKVKELKEKDADLELYCQNLEDLNEKLKNEEVGNSELEKEISKIKKENAKLTDGNKTKDSQVRELQKALVEGSGGEEILQELQDKIKETEENNKMLEKQCGDLSSHNEDLEKKENDPRNEKKEMATELVRIKKENDYLERGSQAKTGEISKLQEKLLDGTGGEEILQELQGQLKELEDMNKELRKKCNEMEAHEETSKEDEDDVNKEKEKEMSELKRKNERLLLDNNEKEKEVSDLQKKLVEGIGGEEVLENIQGQLKKLKEKNEKLEADCSKLEDENESLRGDESKREKERDEMSRLRKENTSLVEENEAKDFEVRELQKKLVDGSGGDEILEKLKDKVQELETNNKALEKQNGDLDIVNQKMGKEEKSLKNENKEMKEEVSRIKKENDYLERESQAKTGEISKLQEKLLDGTGGEEILQELQGQLKELEDMNKELRKKNDEMEAREERSKEVEDGLNKEKEKELSELKRKNKRLPVDNNEKEKEVSDLQKKLVEGTGGEEVLENIQGQLKKLKEKNETLEADCSKLEDENENLRSDESKREDERDEMSRLRKENTSLVEENEAKDIEVRELQKKLVDGSGGEDILEKLQDKVQELETNNKELVKQNGDLDVVNQKMGKEEKSLKNDDKEMKEEVARIKKESDYLEPESQAKTGEISKLQEKLLDGTGGEEILQDLQSQMKALEDMNKELRKKCNEMEAREETSKDDEDDVDKEKEKELSELKRKNERLLVDNNEKEKEVSDLQKKLVEGTGGEEVLENIQGQLKKLKEKDEKLEADCSRLEDENEKLRSDESKREDERDEMSILRKENTSLVEENEAKDIEVRELQKKLVDGCGGEEILEKLQDKVQELETNNKALEKQCGDLDVANPEMGNEEKSLKNDNKEMKEEEDEDDVKKEKELSELKRKNERLLVDNNEKEKEVSDLQKKLVEGTGGEEVLENIQGQLKELKEKNEKLEADCSKLEDENENLRSGESEREEERDEMSRLRKENTSLVEENEAKGIEVRELQKKLVDSSGGEEILEKLQAKVQELETNNKTLVKQNGDLDVANPKMGNEEKSLKNDNKEMKEEVAKIKKENGYLERESQAKTGEISKLQEKLLDGTGGEEILQELQGQLKELEDMNKELRKKNNEMEAREETSKEDEVNKDKEKELSELKRKIELLLLDNNEKEKEVSDLQKKLVEGTGGEEVLENIQGQLKKLKEKNETLEADCSKLEDENEKLRSDESKREEERDEMSRLGKENTSLVEKNGGTSKEDDGEINRKREKELVRMKNEIEKISLDNKTKEEEITELQNKLIEGTVAEEVLEGLQNQVKNLKEKNNDLETNCRDLEDVNTSLKDLESKEQENLEEISKLREEIEDLVVENNKKENEILDLQTKLVSGTGGEEILEQLQNEVKLSKEKNVELKKQCKDLERAVGRRKEDDKMLNEVDKIENECQRLERENEAKTKKIGKLQQNVVKGTGGEEVVEELQNKIKELENANELLEETINSEENTKDSKQTRVKQSEEKRTQLGQLKSENDKLALKNNHEPEEGNTKGTKKTAKKAKKEGKLSTDNGKHHAGSSEDTAGAEGDFATKGNPLTDHTKPNDREEFNEILSYDECVEIIPKITEERDHWKKKYKALRMKVGEQFVDIIPEVWSEEVELEKERDETLSRLSEVNEEIAEHENPLLKTMEENQRLEKELGKIGDLLEDNKGQLEDLRDIQDQEEKNTEEQSRLKQSLADLESSYIGLEDLSLKQMSDEDNDKELCSDSDQRKKEIDEVCQEIEYLLVEAEQHSENKQKDKNGASAMFDKKVEIKSEIKKIERAIEELQQGSSIGSNLNRSSRSSKHLESAEKENSQDSAIQDEFDKVSDGISELESSLGASGVSRGNKVGNLVALMKEKSKLEDELSLADKALNQLGKRDYENLLKERAKQEKVAKKLLELSREKETLEGEFQEIEELVKTKETDLLSYFNSSKEKEQLGEDSTGKRKSSLRKMSSVEEDPVAISSEDDSVKDERENLLSSEGVLGVSEELGSLIQKKSSLSVRLESLGKEITAQSLKVEKSLMGVKEDPTVEISPGSSYSSLDDLSQSQLSIFDDHNMLDELSLATGLVREERLKRKASRKTPMAKLLKEKVGLDKKFKDLEGKVLVQNAKIKNALRDGKDPGKLGGKFTQAVEERKKVEDELTNVAAKIDECKLQSDEVTNKGKLGKRRASTESLRKNGKSSSEKKVGKSLSKNDKRLLLSQRESLTKQLDDVKRKIEDFSMDGDDGGLEVPNDEQSDEEILSSYSGAVSVLRAEKEKKEAVLSGLEKDIEREKNPNSTKDDEKDLRKKRRAVKDKIERVLEELEHEKQNLDTLRDSITNENETNLEKEQLLKDDIAALESQKEELSKELMAGKDSLHKQAKTSGQDLEQLPKEYQEFVNLKKVEEYLEKSLEDINKKLLARKEWVSDFEQPKTTVEVDDNDLAQSYGEILKRMSDGRLNMADLIRELEVTQETLSKEREITRELLDLIKSKVGNQLLGALTGDGLLSPAEMHSTGAEEYQEVASKVEHDSVTVAEIIADYKKINELSQRENQKLSNMLELVKSKVDEDLFESIVNQKPSEVEVPMKYELSKILENNKTVFEQIVANTKAVGVLENENETLKMELEGGREVFEENKEIKGKLENANNEIGILTTELDEVKKEKDDEFERNAEAFEQINKELVSCKEMLEDLQEQNKSIMSKFGDATKRQDELKTNLQYAEEKKDSLEEEIEEINSKLQAAEEMKNEARNKLQKCKESSEETIAAMEIEKNESVSKLALIEKLNDQMKNDLKNEQETKEENKALKEKLTAMENENKNKISLLEDAEREKYEMGEELQRNQAGVEKENEEILCKLNETEKINEGLKNELELNERLKEENMRMKDKIDTLENELDNLNKENQKNKEMTEELKALDELKKENTSIKEMLDVLEKESNEVIPTMDRLKRTNKELEDEIEYLHKKEKDFESIQKKLTDAEREVEQLKEDLKDFESIQKKLTDAEREVEQLKEDLKEFESIQKKLTDAEREVEQLKEDLKEFESIQKKLTDAEREVEQLKEDLKDFESIQKKLTDTEREVEQLKEDLKDFESIQKKLTDAEREVEQLKEDLKEFESIQKKLTDAEREVEQLKDDLKDFESIQKKLSDAEREVEQLKEDLKDFESIQKKLTDAEREVEQLKDDLKEFESIQKKLSDAEREVNEQLKEDLKEFESIQKKLTDAEREVEQLKEDLKEFESIQKKLTDAEREVEQLKDDLKDFESIQKKLSDAEREVEQLKEDLKDFESIQKKLTDAEREVGQLKEDLKEFESIQKKLTDAESEVEQLKEDLKDFESIQKKLTDAERGVEQLKEDLKEFESIQKKLSDAEREVEQLKEDLKDFESIQKKWTDAEREVEQLKEDLKDFESIQKKLTDAEREVEQLKEDLKDFESIQKKWTDAEREVEQLKEDFESIQKKWTDAEREVEQLKEDLKDFESIQKKLTDAEREVEQLKEDLKDFESIQKKWTDAEREVEQLKEDLKDFESIQKKLTDAEREVEQLKEDLKDFESIQKKLTDAEREVEQLKEDLKDFESIQKKWTDAEREVGQLKEDLKDFESIQKKWTDAQREVEQLKEDLKDFESIQKKLTDAQREVEQLKEDLKDFESIQKKLTDAEREVEQLKEDLKDFESIQKKLTELKEDFESIQKKLTDAEREVEQLKEDLKDFESIQKKLTDAEREVEQLKEDLKDFESIQKKWTDAEREVEQLKEDLKDFESIQKKLTDAEREVEQLKEDLKDFESIQKKLTDAQREVEQLKEDLKDFESIQKKLTELKEDLKDFESIQKKLTDAEREVEKLKEDLKDFESIQKKLTDAEREVEQLKEDLKDFESIQSKLTDAEREVEQLKEDLKDFESIQKKLTDAEREVEQLKEDLKDFESIQKKWTDAEREVEQLKEDLKDFESIQKKLTDAEREVGQLKEDLKDFESIQKKLTDAEREVEQLKEDLGCLKIEKDELDNYIGTVLQLNVTGGLKSALEDYSNEFKEMEKENHSLAIECDNLKELKQIIGKTLAEKLLSLSKEQQGSLEDTQSVPKCVEKIVNQRITLARVLEDYEKDLDTVEQHLGQELFSCILNTDCASKNGEDKQPLRITSELKDGKDLTQIVKAYEDLIESQANEIKSAEAVFEKVKTLEAELEDVHKQNQREIEEAEDMLREQRNQHELVKQNLLGRFNDEKNNLQRHIARERDSMETAMQNLINEIVRLKEERKEIRKNNRLEKEKMELAFEKEQAELYSNNEIVKTDIQEKVEKAFFDVSQKEKVMMEERENGLKEEVMKLKNEKREMAVKVKEMETKLEYELNFSKESGQVYDLKEKEKEKAREEIKNEFEETMKQEKKKFQDTLVSLRQEIDRLQHERCKAYDELTKDSTLNEQTADSSVQELRIYERLQSDFKAKIQSERMSMENRIKELWKEREELNKEKQEIKGRMRNQRLELNRKHEKEKEELVEKYRNEMRALREQLHREMQDNRDANTNRSFPDSQNIYELRRVVREKEAKLRTYETFFRELNQEASIFHQDPNIAV